MDSAQKDYQRRLKVLRERALAQISGSSSAVSESLSQETRELLHDLHVHQIELEMQNEELREAHQKLERSRNQYLNLYHNAPVGYVVADSAGMVLQANKTFASMVGFDIPALLRKPLTHSFHPDDSPLFIARYRAFFKQPDDKRFEIRLVRKDLSTLNAELKGHRINSDSTALTDRHLDGHLLISISDISVRKSAEAAILRAKLQWEQTFDAVPDLIAIIDEHLTIVRVNMALARRLGVEPKACVGKKCYEVLHEDGSLPSDCPHQQLYRTGRTIIEHEGFSRRFNGYFITSVLPFEVGYSENHWLIHISRDVTDRKLAEKELLKLRNLESIGKLAGGMAHDFNNILTAVIGHIDLGTLYEKQQDKQRHHLKSAIEAADRARKLANRLITFAEGGNQIKKTVDLTQLLETATVLTLSGTNVAYDLDISTEIPTLIADVDQIKSAIQNILTNAREAMPWGGKVQVLARSEDLERFNGNPVEPGRYVRIDISDNGIGIVADDLGKVFDPYFTTKQMGDQKGMGLGLAICHSIITKHQGHLSVRSKVGEGTTVTLLLPTFVRPAVCEESNSIVVDNAGRENGCRILYMDDEKILWCVIREMLYRFGCDVEFAIDGKEAVSMYKTSLEEGSPYSALILDLTIRGGPGGKEVLQEIHQIDPTAKAVLISGYASDPVFEDHYKYGFMGALTKPFKTEQLIDLMSNILHIPLNRLGDA